MRKNRSFFAIAKDIQNQCIRKIIDGGAYILVNRTAIINSKDYAGTIKIKIKINL